MACNYFHHTASSLMFKNLNSLCGVLVSRLHPQKTTLWATIVWKIRELCCCVKQYPNSIICTLVSSSWRIESVGLGLCFCSSLSVRLVFVFLYRLLFGCCLVVNTGAIDRRERLVSEMWIVLNHVKLYSLTHAFAPTCSVTNDSYILVSVCWESSVVLRFSESLNSSLHWM